MGDRPINAHPLGGPREVVVTVRLEPDVHPNQGDGISTHRDLLGRPVVSLRSMSVDAETLGDTIVALLAGDPEAGR